MINKSKLLALAAAGTVAWAVSATAADDKGLDLGIPGEFSATLTGTSNYVFRGITQSDNDVAIQGSFGYSVGLTKSVNLDLSVWASSIDFNDGDQATVEVDYTGGFSGSIGNFSWAAVAIYYSYPSAAGRLNYDYVEGGLSGGYDFGLASVTAAVNYSPDYFASTGAAWYKSVDVSIPIKLPASPTIGLHIGHQDIANNAGFGTPDYVDWSVGLGVKVEGFDIEVKYTDTDLRKAECFGGTKFCSSMAIVTVSRSF